MTLQDQSQIKISKILDHATFRSSQWNHLSFNIPANEQDVG